MSERIPSYLNVFKCLGIFDGRFYFLLLHMKVPPARPEPPAIINVNGRLFEMSENTPKFRFHQSADDRATADLLYEIFLRIHLSKLGSDENKTRAAVAGGSSEVHVSLT